MARLVQFLVLGAASLLGVTMGTGYRAGHGVQPAPPTGSEPGIQVRRLHPLSPADALKSFQLEVGFQLELVAHEPSVKDPVAAVYDEDGRLYVCEMGDYPGHGETPEGVKGRVSQLLDADGDGFYETHRVFVAELANPSSVACYRGGLFILAAPDLWYCKDTDDNGIADQRELVFTGFGVNSLETLANNLKWGIDNKLYGASSHSGGTITVPPGQPGRGLDLQGSDFCFDPRTRILERVSRGDSRWGNSFNDAYDRFVCQNTGPARHVVLPSVILSAGAFLPSLPAYQSLALEGGTEPVYRASPPEPWRVVRADRRQARGKNANPGEINAAGYFTSSCGITVYRGDAYPPEYRGNLFVGEAAGNLVHRRTLVPEGVSYSSSRVGKENEFLASTDNYFRAVNFINAPDGTLQVVDMYREVVEGPSWVPADLKASGQVDVMGGADRGRIYRIVPVDYVRRPSPALSQATSADLVDLLAHDSSWWRETAQRLLVQRRDHSITRLLRRKFRKRSSAATRIHLAWALQGLGMLTAEDITLLLSDPRKMVQRHGVRLIPYCPDFQSSIPAALARPSASGDPAVCMQWLAWIAGLDLEERRKRVYIDFLSRVTRPEFLAPSGDRPAWLQRGVVVAATGSEGALAEAVLARQPPVVTETISVLLEQLSLRAGAAGEERNLLRLLKAFRTRDPDGQDGLTLRLLAASRVGEIQSGKTAFHLALSQDNASRDWQKALQMSVLRGLESRSDVELTMSCLTLSDLFLPELLLKNAGRFISVGEAPAVRAAAVKALARLENDQVLGLFIETLPASPPGTQALITEEIFRRSTWTGRLLDEIREGGLPRTLVTLSRQASLQQHPDGGIKQAAVELYGMGVNRDREDIIERYLEALTLEGNAERGSEVFKRECTMCHRFGVLGHDVGPNLSAYGRGATTPEGFLRNILDPNRNVPADFMEYSAVLTDGRVVAGLLRDPTPTTVTFRRDKTESVVVPRARIDVIKSTGKSFMPVGLEKKISVQQMADLLAFLARIQQRL